MTAYDFRRILHIFYRFGKQLSTTEHVNAQYSNNIAGDKLFSYGRITIYFIFSWKYCFLIKYIGLLVYLS